ncbi:hypothetical protein DAMA08_020930, partial (mitochondrion) [Martiniozyma asiatica (nom. inval.)]
MTQSAGNLKKGSSETMREMGFMEGDGAILCYDKRMSLVMTQKDYRVLEEMRNTLNMGVMRYTYKGGNSSMIKENMDNMHYGRFVVSNMNEMYLLYLLLNGNLRTKHRVEQLNRW